MFLPQWFVLAITPWWLVGLFLVWFHWVELWLGCIESNQGCELNDGRRVVFISLPFFKLALKILKTIPLVSLHASAYLSIYLFVYFSLLSFTHFGAPIIYVNYLLNLFLIIGIYFAWPFIFLLFSPKCWVSFINIRFVRTKGRREEKFIVIKIKLQQQQKYTTQIL